MTDSIKQQFEVYSNALGIRNKRNEILASNIANAATPNYKARDVDFEVELARALSVGPLKTSNKGHIALPSKNLPGKVQYRDPLTLQWMVILWNYQLSKWNLLKIQLDIKLPLNFINSKLTGLMSAIRGE